MKNLRALSLTFLFMALTASFYFTTPKKGVLRNELSISLPVAKADTPTSVTLIAEENPPVVSSLSLNSGNNIDLTSNTTKAVSLSGEVTDNDGCGDIATLNAAIYLSALDLNCSADANSCYTNLTCNTTSCTDGTAEVTCISDLWFHANPAQWVGSIMATDGSGNTDNTTSSSVTVNELQALLVDSPINYGALSVLDTSATQPATVTVTGNVAINCSLSGTDMTSASQGATVGVNYQKYDLTNTVYDSLSNTLLETQAALDIAITDKPSTHPSDQWDVTYWGLLVPDATPSAADYGGTNTFEATATP